MSPGRHCKKHPKLGKSEEKIPQAYHNRDNIDQESTVVAGSNSARIGRSLEIQIWTPDFSLNIKKRDGLCDLYWFGRPPRFLPLRSEIYELPMQAPPYNVLPRELRSQRRRGNQYSHASLLISMDLKHPSRVSSICPCCNCILAQRFDRRTRSYKVVQKYRVRSQATYCISFAGGCALNDALVDEKS